MKRLLAATALLLAFAAPPAFAWGALGHRLVAALAQEELTPAARDEVDRLLAGEADPTLTGIASWADELRSKDPGLGRRSAKWHYVNIGEHDCTYDAARDCPGGNCVVEALREQAGILADRSRPLAERRQALKFVVHFVGDIHQPLHAGYARDKGGNAVQVRIPTAKGGDRGGNLHSLWDSGLLASTGQDEAATLARLHRLPLAVALTAEPLPPPAAAWAEASCRIAVSDGLYPPAAKLPAGYVERWLPVVDAQLRRGGTHLAQVLNAALGR